MGTRQSASHMAAEDVRRMAEKVRTEIRDTRLALGISQSDLARAGGVSRWRLGRIERGTAGDIRIEEACHLLRAVGLAAHLSTSPTGERVRDGASLRILGRFAGLVAPPLALPREVLLPGRDELRAWDANVVADHARAFVEVVSRLGDMQAIARYLAIKMRDDGRSAMLILVVGRTNANQAVLGAHREALRQMLPLDGAAIARHLRAGRLPPAGGIIVL